MGQKIGICRINYRKSCIFDLFSTYSTPTPRNLLLTYVSHIFNVFGNHTILVLSAPSRGGKFWEFLRFGVHALSLDWTQIWRVAGRESGYPELLGSPRTSPEVPQTSPEVFRPLPRKFSHCGTSQQSRGSPEVSQTSPEVPRTSPEVPGLPGGLPFLWEA